MIEEILNLSRLESDHASYEMKPIDLSELVHRVGEKFENICAEKQIELTIEVAPHCFVIGDFFKLEQVIYNFTGNAITHAQGATRIQIRCQPESDGIRLAVSDDGVGIPKHIQSDLWERFYKGEKNSKAGTGLGLAIAAAILKAHGGFIRYRR